MSIPCWGSSHGAGFVPAVGPKAEVIRLIEEAVEGITSPESAAEEILAYLEQEGVKER